MKRLLSLLLALALLTGLAACGTKSDSAADASAQPSTQASSGSSAQPVELTVFAAASMTETLNQIAELYKKAAPDVTLTFNFDSSGTLKTQIQEGAECDVFVSAGQKQMDQLDIAADASVNTEKLDFVVEDSRINLLENRVALCVPKGNPAGINSFDDLAKKLPEGKVLLAMGNSDVPVGQYASKILKHYGLDENALAGSGTITYGSNVKEVTTQITEGSVGCGIVYCTDAYSAGLTPVAYATSDMCGQVIYPAAVMKKSAHPKEAQAFLDYLRTKEAMAVFEKVGFSAV